MNLIAETARVGALVVDSLPYSNGGTPKIAAELAKEGVACLVGYLGAITRSRVGFLLDAGIAFMPVTFGTAPEHYSGPETVARCRALGLPEGCSVWLDMEGLPAWNTDAPTLMADVNTWADAIAEAGFMPCLYVGVPQPLTSEQLCAVKTVRYWHGQGTVTDRAGHSSAPACGYVMVQQYPSKKRASIDVDDNELRADELGRLPAWVVGDDPIVYSSDIVHPIVDLGDPGPPDEPA